MFIILDFVRIKITIVKKHCDERKQRVRVIFSNMTLKLHNLIQIIKEIFCWKNKLFSLSFSATRPSSQSWIELTEQISEELLFRFLSHTDIDKWGVATSAPFLSRFIKHSGDRKSKWGQRSCAPTKIKKTH